MTTPYKLGLTAAEIAICAAVSSGLPARADQLNIPAAPSFEEQYIDMMFDSVKDCEYAWLDRLPAGMTDRDDVAEYLVGKCVTIVLHATHGVRVEVTNALLKRGVGQTPHDITKKVAYDLLALRFGSVK
jgi:hypothetical protein